MNGAETIREGLAILLPVVVLVLVAAALPIWLTRRLGAHFGGRAANIAISAVVLTLLSAAYFVALYLIHDPRVAGAIGNQPLAAAGHFLWLGLMAGLVWGPVMVLAATIRPREGGR